jgi:hypothetical protein
MTTDALWISETYLKDNSIINDNADFQTIQPVIILTQDKYIHPILGTRLFDSIADQITASSVSAANQTLLNLYVRKCLMWYILHESPAVFKYRFMNKGVMVKSSENSQPADLKEIQYLENKFKQNAEWYAERTTKFLVDNNSTYTLYDANSDIDEIKPNKSNFTSSLYLGDDCDDCLENLIK